MSSIVYLDQNVWVALAKGSWDKKRYPREHAALTKVVHMVQSGSIIIPLSFANIYETAKVNVPRRRANLARTQSLISGGIVFRGRRRILTDTLTAYIAKKHGISQPSPPGRWFLSDLWFETTEDYSPETFEFTITERLLAFIRRDPVGALFDYLAFGDADVQEMIKELLEGGEQAFSTRRTKYGY